MNDNRLSDTHSGTNTTQARGQEEQWGRNWFASTIAKKNTSICDKAIESVSQKHLIVQCVRNFFLLFVSSSSHERTRNTLYTFAHNMHTCLLFLQNDTSRSQCKCEYTVYVYGAMYKINVNSICTDGIQPIIINYSFHQMSFAIFSIWNLKKIFGLKTSVVDQKMNHAICILVLI